MAYTSGETGVSGRATWSGGGGKDNSAGTRDEGCDGDEPLGVEGDALCAGGFGLELEAQAVSYCSGKSSNGRTWSVPWSACQLKPSWSGMTKP